ncbi:hypothetical protein [Pararhodobacter sp.]|uniref:hypothetical protein n=1 Tax=Pararhodobacter sp. TaxID=2127056 RepID=UPI002AFFA1EF|nr:hypothetical protein [Pararhodobacter sp.]
MSYREIRARFERLIGDAPPFQWAGQRAISPATFDRFWNKEQMLKRSTLARIAIAAGVTPEWLIDGSGPDPFSPAGIPAGGSGLEMRADPVDAPSQRLLPQRIDGLFPDLLAFVVDAIQRTYKDAGASLSALDLGRLSAEKYNEIIAEIPEPEGWPVAVRMMAVQLRKDIASTAANPSARKREAS